MDVNGSKCTFDENRIQSNAYSYKDITYGFGGFFYFRKDFYLWKLRIWNSFCQQSQINTE